MRCIFCILYMCEEDAALQNLVKSEVPIKRRAQTLGGGGGGWLSRKSDNSAHWQKKKTQKIVNFSTEKIHL